MKPYLPGQSLENLIETAIPEFVRAEYPVFVDYLKVFLRLLEQERTFTEVTVSSEYGTLVNNQVLTTNTVGGASYETRKLLEYRDDDTTLDDFVPHFLQMFAKNFPRRTFVSPQRFIDTLRYLYTHKSIEDTVFWFFRVLFNEHAEIYYPREDVLRASDGTWLEEISIKVSSPTNGYENAVLEAAYLGQRIQTATGLAQVDRVRTTIVGQSYGQYLYVNELILKRESITGSFAPGQDVWNTESVPEIHTTIIPVIAGVTVLSGGENYVVGDLVTFSEGPGLGEGYGAAGIVTSVSKSPLSGVRINGGGDGYVVGDPLVFTSSTGENAEAVVDQVVYGNILLDGEDGFLLTETAPSGERQYVAQEDHNYIPQDLSIELFITANGGVLPLNAPDYSAANQATWNLSTTMDYVLASIGSVPFMHPWTFGDASGNTANVTLANTMLVVTMTEHDGFLANGDHLFVLASPTDIVTTNASATAYGKVVVSDITTGRNRNRVYVSNTAFPLGVFVETQTVKSDRAVLQTGVVTCTTATSNVTGSGTVFTETLAPYSHLTIAGNPVVVKSITNNTFLTLWSRPVANSTDVAFYAIPTGVVQSVTDQAQRNYGKIRHIAFISPGTGYLTPPIVTVDSISARAQALYHYDP